MNESRMSRKQARILWNSLTPQQKSEFNMMIDQLNKGKLSLSKVLVDDKEQLQRIVLSGKQR